MVKSLAPAGQLCIRNPLIKLCDTANATLKHNHKIKLEKISESDSEIDDDFERPPQKIKISNESKLDKLQSMTKDELGPNHLHL